MSCEKCGNKIAVGDAFCKVCGAQVTSQNNTELNVTNQGSVETTQVFNDKPMGQGTSQNNKNKLFLIIVSVVIVVVILELAFYLFKDNGKVVEVDGVSLYIPEGYSKNPYSTNDSIIYHSEDYTIAISTYSFKNSGLSLSDYKGSLDDSALYDTCSKPTEKKINGSTWLKMDCSGTNGREVTLVGINNNKIYYVVVDSEDKKSGEFKKLERKVEKNLKFTN